MKTIKDAISKFDKRQQKALRRMWKTTSVGDYYGGDLTMYLEVIAQCYERDHKHLRLLRRLARSVCWRLELGSK